jgi:hypothetical protein
MSSTDLHDDTGDRPGDGASNVLEPPGPLAPRPGVDDEMPPAPVDQNGEIARWFLRRQPARIVGGRVQGGWTGAFELICCDCGDNPYLDYSEVSPRLQRLRGPYTLPEGAATYQEHLRGRWSCPMGARPWSRQGD